MKTIIKERTERIRQTFSNLKKLKDLYAEIALPKRIISNLQFLSKLVVYDSLNSYYKNDFFDLDIPTEKFFIKYKTKIFELPNITPNGLVLPKSEILSSVNLFNKAVYELIDFLDIKDKADIACPVNLRLNFGVNRNKTFNERPKSSTYWHTDIWAGQNSNEMMIHTPIFGDFDKNGISICNPSNNFYPNFVKTIDHFYHNGNEVTHHMDKEGQKPKMKTGTSYIFDSFLFHKTRASGSGIRGIVSFPIKLKQQIYSDIYQNPLRDSEYKSAFEWAKIGNQKILISKKSILEKNWKDESKNIYADKFETIDVL